MQQLQQERRFIGFASVQGFLEVLYGVLGPVRASSLPVLDPLLMMGATPIDGPSP